MGADTGAGILGALGDSNAIITLGIEIAGELIPIVRGTIAEIKQITSKTDAIQYSVLIEADDADLAKVDSMSAEDLAAINDELERLGKPPLPVPPASSAPPSDPPAA